MSEIPSPRAGAHVQSNEEWALRSAIARECQRIVENPDYLPWTEMILSAIEQTGWKLVYTGEIR